uniref:Reverse transcriptase domain-containing protein n=1 Tax=Rousettus aegyptiacus TaxID=9407 RepID=A0A7J8FIS1_ROUAE|nr:hypothetical protein HJG63_011939 [Rousettus aegyptiacus]
MKDKNLMINSIDAEKQKCGKGQNLTSFHNLKFNKLDIEGMYLNIIKPIYEKATTNIISNSERLNTFLLKSSTRQGYSLLPLLFNIVLKVLARAIRQEIKIKCTQIGNEEVKSSLFSGDMFL